MDKGKHCTYQKVSHFFYFVFFAFVFLLLFFAFQSIFGWSTDVGENLITIFFLKLLVRNWLFCLQRVLIREFYFTILSFIAFPRRVSFYEAILLGCLSIGNILLQTMCITGSFTYSSFLELSPKLKFIRLHISFF